MQDVEAATRIQAAVRGRLARKRIVGLKAAPPISASSLEVMEEGLEVAGRSLDASDGTAEEERAAIRIQAVVRGRRVRAAQAGRQANGEGVLEAAHGNVGGRRVDAQEGWAEEERAATRIQAVVRGRRARSAQVGVERV